MDIINSFICLLFFLYNMISCYMKNQKKQHKRGNLKVPPGSMGWPLIGETLQMYSQDPNIFFSTRQKRYGDIFKTRILGYPCIMLASPEASRFVLVSHAHLFKPTYPKGKEKLIGPAALFFHQGEYHAQLRKIVQNSLSPQAIRKVMSHIEEIAISSLESLANGNVVNTFHHMKMYSFEVGIQVIFGHLDKKYKDELKENYSIVEKGYNSFPTTIPGTAFYKALQARERLKHIISEIIWERKEHKLLEKDLLGQLLTINDEEGEIESLSEDEIADNVIGVLFAAQDTTASVLTWILKYLHDNDKLLEEVKAEQIAIYKSNDGEKHKLTWGQAKSMPLTTRVISESLRMSSIISFTFREAVVDIAYNGYLIPKGWKVMPLFRNIHHNPDFFPYPQTFDPSRFNVSPKPNTYMPFGNGSHACPGNELSKIEMLILVHHLVTNFRWEVVECEGLIEYSPFPVPKHGLRARFYKQ